MHYTCAHVLTIVALCDFGTHTCGAAMRPDRRVEQNAQPTPDPTQACARCIACAAASAPAQQAQSAPTHQSAPSAAHTARIMPGHSAHMSPGASCNSRLPPCRSPRRFLCPPPGGPQPPGGTKSVRKGQSPCLPFPSSGVHARTAELHARADRTISRTLWSRDTKLGLVLALSRPSACLPQQQQTKIKRFEAGETRESACD